MEIVKQTNNEVKFEELEISNIFEYKTCYFMRIPDDRIIDPEEDGYCIVNAINLEWGTTAAFDKDCQVIPYYNCKLILG